MPSLAPHPILAAALLAVRAKTLKPTPKLDLVQWADAFRYLSPEAASQPGRWATKAVEVARGPMLAVTEPGVHEITVMCCTQLMKTELLLNVIGYFTHQDPAPMLLLQPTVELAEAFSKDRIDPMFRDSPVLRDLLGDKRSRDANNTILHKSFPGGHLTMVGSNAPGNLAMRPVRVVLCDEVDKYPASAGNEGDPIKLAMERSATFWNWLVITTCSPTLAGVSRIEKNYERSDKRVFSVPCPHCGDAREMQWQHVLWTEGQPETAAYRCPECGCLWSEPERLRAIARGSWVATRPFNGHAGFAVSKLASPWESLSKLARKWEDCGNDPLLIRTFFNTQLAKTWREVGEAPPWQALYDKRGPHPRGIVPAEYALLTGGVDVQQDRLEVEIVAWAPGKRSFSLDYRVIMGDTKTEAPWSVLAELITTETWPHASGALMPLRFTAIDSGYRTTTVYDFCRNVGVSRIAPIKGRDDQPIIVNGGKAIETKRDGKALWRGVRLYMVGVNLLKSELYAWLRLNKPAEGPSPAGYCAFPEDYDEQHFRELTSEAVTIKPVRGVSTEAWQKTPGVRNEPLDCRVYARAAAAILGIDRWGDAHWRKARAAFPVAPEPTPDEQPASPSPPDPRPGARRQRTDFWDRSR